MTDHFPNQSEVEMALKKIDSIAEELDVHERLILHNFRIMYINEQKEILSHLIDRAVFYNNTMIVAGYAAFFAAWTFFRNENSSMFYDLSMLLMLLSVFAFVLWNVFSSISMSNMLFEKGRIISSHSHDPIYLYKTLRQFDQKLLDYAMARKFWWLVMLWMAIAPGIMACTIFFIILSLIVYSRLI